METRKFINQKKRFYNLLIKFLESVSLDDKDYQKIINFIDNQKIVKNRTNLQELLRLIAKISENHHRHIIFFNKIEHILLYIKFDIKQSFINSEIFHIFKNDKRILCFLFENKILKCDFALANLILKRSNKIGQHYCLYFFQEIHPFIDEEDKARIESSIDSRIVLNYDKKRLIGENDFQIAQQIRNDLLKDFTNNISKSNLSLKSKIVSSIFETNSFLLKREETTFIEYAAFFGSMQIFNYLRSNGVELTPSLWLYAIHSNNIDLINLLEENKVEPEDKSYEKCLEEAIKCHHNEMAKIIQSFLLSKKTDILDEKDYLFKTASKFGFHYNNWANMSFDFDNKLLGYYLIKYDYLSLVKFFMKKLNLNVNEKIIQKTFLIKSQKKFSVFI